MPLPHETGAVCVGRERIAVAGFAEVRLLDRGGAQSGALVAGAFTKALAEVGGCLCAASDDGTLRAWSVDDLAPCASAELGVGARVAVAMDGSLVVGVADGTVHRWRVGGDVERLGALKHPQAVSGIARAGSLLATASLARSVRLSDPETGARVAVFDRLRSLPWALAAAPDGRTVAVAVGHAIERFEVPTLRNLGPWKEHRALVSALLWCEEGLWSGAEDGTVIVRDAAGRAQRTLAGRGRVTALAGDGAVVCVARAPKR
ncbi:MAG: hypothetical protein M5U28_22515 [Sandaracinaceae bacterium]|nr:hypothetical protein [Sandaracinaceae bacterium]